MREAEAAAKFTAMHHALAIISYVLLVIACAMWVLGNRLSKHYLAHRPSEPQPDEGRILAYAKGGKVVYLTVGENVFVGKPMMVLVMVPWMLSLIVIVAATL
ncbi:MAG: hypothetical protein ACREQE_02260 [Candidatus Binataceae bacterium]